MPHEHLRSTPQDLDHRLDNIIAMIATYQVSIPPSPPKLKPYLELPRTLCEISKMLATLTTGKHKADEDTHYNDEDDLDR